MVKYIKTNKEILVSIMILIICLIINIFCFFDQYNQLLGEEANYVSAYSFWRFVTTYGIWDYVVVLMPIIIGIGCVYKMHKEIVSGVFKDISLRCKYNKYILKQIINCYKKTFILVLIYNLITFLIGIILFKAKLNTTDLNTQISSYFDNGIGHPSLYFILTIISNYIGMLFMCNMALIFSRLIRKFYLSTISTFMCFNFICLCGEIYGRYFLYESFHLEYFKWLSPYRLLTPQASDIMSYNILFGIILFFISLIILLIIYLGKKNKERLVLRNE